MGTTKVIRSLILVIAILLALSQTVHAQTSDALQLPVPPVKHDCDASGAVFTGTQDFNPNAPDWTGYAYPYNLLYKEWMRIGGPDSPIGCPVGQPHTDDAGIVVQFEHGQIAVSPNVWEQGVVAAYQDNLTGNGIIVDWTVSWDDPSHYNYTKFIVRWDYNGQHFDDVDPKPCERGDGDQCDVLADMTEVQLVFLTYYHDTHLRTKGTFNLPTDHEDGTYRIAIEGCDEPAPSLFNPFPGSMCRQGWMHAVEVNFQAKTDGSADFPIDLTMVPTATDVTSSQNAFHQRAAAITLHNACLPLLPYSAYRHEEDYTSIILAKLDYANYYQEDYCPGENRGGPSKRQQAFDSLAKQSVDSRVGTTVDDVSFVERLFTSFVNAYRTGEYDVALSGYIQVINRFGDILPGDVKNHIINVLLNKRGPIDPDDFGYTIGVTPLGSVQLPETENHLNLIESARYLTNDVLFALTHDPQYDNANNAGLIGSDEFGHPIVMTMRDYWLKRLQSFLQTDFIEYNARPYQGYTMRALQNLYSYAKKDDPVKAAAGMVLDYVSAKVAASSNDNRRAVPYRRKAEYNDPWLIGFHADPQSARMLALVGDLSILEQTPRNGFYAHWYGRPDMEMAILSSYRVPHLILDLMINPEHRLFYQGLHHYADELYAASPSFLISAGGHYATYAYTASVGPGAFGDGDDIGLALPTTVMPTGFFLSRDDLIRFEGSSDDTARSNMCVAPNFACGINPVVPDSILGCVVPNDPNEPNNPWTFINFTAACRKDNDGSPVGFYAALYQLSDVSSEGKNIKTGFVEVFDTQVNPNVSFDEFKAHVIADNGEREYHSFAPSNIYVTITGQEIGFEFAPDSRILNIVNGPAPVQSTADMATGTIIQSSGTSGLITITNPYTGEQLTLDDRDPYNPREY